MSLCSLALATGLTAKPPGSKECFPNGKERPMEEKLKYATPMGKPILKNFSGAPATNDRSADGQKNEIY